MLKRPSGVSWVITDKFLLAVTKEGSPARSLAAHRHVLGDDGEHVHEGHREQSCSVVPEKTCSGCSCFVPTPTPTPSCFVMEATEVGSWVKHIYGCSNRMTMVSMSLACGKAVAAASSAPALAPPMPAMTDDYLRV